MSEPEPKPARPRPGAPVRFHALMQALPAIGLVAGFLAMIFHAVPPTNHDYIVAVIGGLLGYIARGAQSKLTKGGQA